MQDTPVNKIRSFDSPSVNTAEKHFLLGTDNNESLFTYRDHSRCNKTAEQEALLRAGITLALPTKGCKYV